MLQDPPVVLQNSLSQAETDVGPPEQLLVPARWAAG